MKKRKWSAGTEQPARCGVYQRKFSWGIKYCHWNGKHWGIGSDSIDQAVSTGSQITHYPQRPWRELS